MSDTDKKVCRLLASRLSSHGVRRVVVSPGTRNAPLITALEASGAFALYPVVDERSAAFIALGMADAADEPVAVVCTSGTASLNYAPAVAEAYYRHVPLIVLTADRPGRAVGQMWGQTILQDGIYNNYINGQISVSDDEDAESVESSLSKVLAMADNGPVHINVHLEEPLGGLVEHIDDEWSINHGRVPSDLSQLPTTELLAHALTAGRTWVVLGPAVFGTGSRYQEAISKLVQLPDVVVMHEATSGINAYSDQTVSDIASTLAAARNRCKAFLPEYIVTAGTALVSQSMTAFVSSIPGVKHISVNTESEPVDTYGRLAETVKATPRQFANIVISILCDSTHADVADSGFKRFWLGESMKARQAMSRILGKSPWCQLKAMNEIFKAAPRCDLQLGNGMTVRLAQFLQLDKFVSVGCNRGVSGIDGSTSTAIGYAAASGRPMLFVSGDMAFQYDMGALACGFIPDSFRAVVVNNSGGGIFRYIRNTKDIPVREKYLSDIVNLPLRGLCDSFGFNYFRAGNDQELKCVLEAFFEMPRAVLEIVTDCDMDINVYNDYNRQLTKI